MNFTNLSARRALVTPREELFELGARPLGDCFHRAVRTVRHPPGDPELPGLFGHGSAKINALHSAFDAQMNTSLPGAGLHRDSL